MFERDVSSNAGDDRQPPYSGIVEREVKEPAMNIEVTGELESAIKTHAARQGMTADTAARRVLAEALMPVNRPACDTRTGAALIEALQASPCRELDIEPPRVLLTNIRDVDL